MEWETVIGLEVHVQLNTLSKIFSGASTQFGQAPNTSACAIDLGLPGVLPVLNKEAVTKAIRFGLAVDARIAKHSAFDRKNYFYPDLPKGYQISQFTYPIVSGGHLDIYLKDEGRKRIDLTRAHLEEDAGKSLHEDFSGFTGIDLNRAGTPLLEIVSEPQMRSAKEAIAYLKTLHALVRYLDICDGNMQEGSFRCDANVSVRRKGDTQFGTRVEIKNVNSFRFVERAIDFEVERQIELIESGGKVVQETRLYDSVKNETRSMRSKEDAQDYRYFPEPDLLPVEVTDAMIDAVRTQLPELPNAKFERFISSLGLPEYDAGVLVSSKALADYFEAVLALTGNANAKLASNWIMVEVLGVLNKDNLEIEDCPISPTRLAGLLNRLVDATISGKIAKTVFEFMWKSGKTADEIIAEQGLKQVTDTSEIMKFVDEAIAENAAQWQELLSGKDKLLGFFVGEVMKRSKGKANPQQANQLVRERMEKK